MLSRTLILGVGLLAAATLPAQDWVSFKEQHSQRLRIVPFADDPTGNPRDDSAEKDMATGDLDRDGRDDVVVVRKTPFSNPGARQDLLLMNEAGVLVDRTIQYAPGFRANLTDARDVFIGDFTGDGWLDVVIANTFEQQPSFYRNAGQDADGDWLGLVDESQLRFPVIEVPGDLVTLQFCAVWGGDLTGDGALDLYFSNYRDFGGTRDVLFINDGSGTFSNETEGRLGSLANVAFGTGVEIHDMDADGDQDIVKISTLYEAPPFDIGQFILFNDGNGVFTTLPFQALDTEQPYMFTAGDLNEDGLLDLYLQSDGRDRLSIAQNAEPGHIDYETRALTTSESPRTRGFGGNTKMADVDGDGALDVGVAPIDVDIGNCGFSDPLFALLRNQGDGFLFEPWLAADDQNFHVDAHDFGFLDVNADSCLDMLMGLCAGWRIFIQEGCDATSPRSLAAVLPLRGELLSGGKAEVIAADDQYLRIAAAPVGGDEGYVSNTLFVIDTGEIVLSQLDLTVEIGADVEGVRTLILLRDFTTRRWERLDAFEQPREDTRRVFTDVAEPNRYLSRGDGRMLLRVQTLAAGAQVGEGYVLRIDQVEVAAAQ